jgi:hypothetical protein
MTTGPVQDYLTEHLAAAAAEERLFIQAAQRERGGPHGAELAGLRAAVQEDRSRLRALALRLGAREVRPKKAIRQLTEKLGRLRPNRSPVGRSPLSDLAEIEAMRVSVTYKWVGWRGLLATEAAEDPSVQAELYSLVQRAREQALRLDRIHDDVALAVLGETPTRTSHADDRSHRS